MLHSMLAVNNNIFQKISTTVLKLKAKFIETSERCRFSLYSFLSNMVFSSCPLMQWHTGTLSEL